MTDTLELEARVLRGIALLDERMPGWRDKVDVEDLDIESGSRCICGQLGWSVVADAAPEVVRGVTVGAIRFGFYSDHDDYPSLTEIWKCHLTTPVPEEKKEKVTA